MFVLACSLGLAAQAQAEALTLDSARYIGSVTPGTPTSPSNEVSYINQLLSMPLNGDATVGSNDFDRSAFACTGCVTATITGDLADLTGNTTSLGTGFTYLYVKYSAIAGSYVWDIRGLTGTIGPFGGGASNTFPTTAGAQNNEFSHYALFNPTTTVPEPSTLISLGLGILALGGVARRFRK